MKNLPSIPNTEFLLYQTEDGKTRIEVRYSGDSIWLSINQMADLFEIGKSAISKHISNIYEEGELLPEATVSKLATVGREGSRTVERAIEYYNLEVVIAVGYRVRSLRGTQFRIWATQRLGEYITKGFTMDDDRLKQSNDGGLYFDELLERIRDIRSSEKVFWRKVLDIYATSIDYNPKSDVSVEFFKVIQNKIHWASHGHTAAEVIANRADAKKENMGLTSWKGDSVKRTDVKIAKNYLAHDELDTLNRIVTLYLEFAELQAKNRKVMSMKDWVSKLDDFLKISDKEVLTHAGKISQKVAEELANKEYDEFSKNQLPSKVEMDFDKTLKNIEVIEKRIPLLKENMKKTKKVSRKK